MAGTLVTLPRQTPFSGGTTVAGAKLFVYEAGTTTKRNAYTTSALSVQHSNPVVADANGRFAGIYVDPDGGAYKLVLAPSGDTDPPAAPIWTEDNIPVAFSATPSYPQTEAEIAASVTPSDLTRSPDAPAYDIRRAGGVMDGSTNGDTALARAIAAADVVYLPEGDLLVSSFPSITSGVRFIGPGRFVTSTSHRRTWEYGGEASTWSNLTYYVNPAGDDSNTGLTAGSAFKTIQRAINQLPPLIQHRITIQLADGTYNEQEFSASDMARPAMVWLVGKHVKGRTDQSGSGGVDTTGFLLIKGTSKAGTIIQTSSSFPYGVYCSQVNNVGLDELTIQSNYASTQALLVAHRPGTYIQCSNVDLDGNSQAAGGAFAEAGAVLEMTGDSDIYDCTVGIQAFDLSDVVHANTGTISSCTIGVNIAGGIIQLAGPVTCSSPINGQSGLLKIEGSDTSNRVTVSGAINLDNTEVTAVYAHFSGAITAYGSDIYFNTVGYSNAITMYGGNLRLQAADSYISPASASTVAVPVTLAQDASFVKDSSSEIVGSGGRTNAVYGGVFSHSIDANSTELNVQGGGGQDIYLIIDGDSGTRTGCTLPDTDTSFGGEWAEGQRLHIISSDSNTVEIVDSTTADIVGGTVTVGVAASAYQAVSFIWLDGLWRELSRSLVGS